MNVLLVSQCDKNALKESRRVLDQFAERKGDRTWQTAITQEGLNTLRRLLRKSARRNTAVACHWIRGRDHSELVWVVGDAGRFGLRGTVPTSRTARDVLRRDDENDWHTGQDIALLAGMAALLHDLGKACAAFQKRLRNPMVKERNLYRHEWISLRLFQAFVGDDDDETWLARLQHSGVDDDAAWLQRLQRDALDVDSPTPFQGMPPLASAIGWLVLTHHRLPLVPEEAGAERSSKRLGAKVSDFRSERLRNIPGCIHAGWNEACDTTDPKLIAPYWRFDERLPVLTDKWRQRAGRLAGRLLKRLPLSDRRWLDNAYVMHLARLSLMLADHYYSSLGDGDPREQGEPGYPLYANTDRASGKLKQPLDEHLIGVEAHSQAVSNTLPGFERHLPRLRHKGFRRRSADARFRWQDKAYDLAASLRDRSREQGFFGVNMASTGCGKTLANGRILYALADPERGARFSIALGLRTLTLQTGKAYREMLGLGEDELAVRVGGAANRALYEHYEEMAEQSGSASSQSLLHEDNCVLFEGNLETHPVLKRVAHDPGVKALLSAPVMVCTVDHLVPATESQRGGRQIAPMLRLMSSDLVLDEPDDFDMDDLPALTRLVHWAGLLGSRVLLSSATLPPSLIQGLYQAYREGRAVFQRNRGEPGLAVDVCCAWFDEHDRMHQDCADSEAFATAHDRFAQRRRERLAQAPVRRRCELVPLRTGARQKSGIRQELAGQMLGHAQALHQAHHSIDPRSGKRVSFGLIRMANIEPLFDVALAMYGQGAASGQRIHLCVYHSQYPLLLRSAMEARLDQALNRRVPDAAFDLPDIREHLDVHEEQDHLFIVLGSPVTEVGRDHDYDWAVVEPSSMRSLIQLAGRVRRHREGECETANLRLLDTNLRHLERPGQPAYCKPGFEDGDEFRLSSHRLERLLEPSEYQAIDARPRITARDDLRPNDKLVDLEHARLGRHMLAPVMAQAPTVPEDISQLSARQRKRLRAAPKLPPSGAYSWYALPRAHLTAGLQQHQRFREDNTPRVDLVLMPDESGENYTLMRLDEQGRHKPPLPVQVENSQNHRVRLDELAGPRINPWGGCDYITELVALAEARGMALEACALRFGTVTLPDNDGGWRFHPSLGFATQR
ncbi:type I-F CRISPR-associated helicase Cas3f [Alkalilimnicola sp. S0819]|uniref:type I-F CRISPR-associated helicase Cas3f n=1 Tax=Alkalilimnicola sp. S0819 TaxID=2613922 RepID=UPI001261C98C|nr:type I-F CRISPR-associated helicase Cas3f [Alkalilimnicola sp. S0819]KAB7624018.1 type I-F CRISPR-associated helicase Cas3 [Alkalilimnicola sp. S0819]MPQ16626.1 type I-F CRISPR-associated helicase Cas3 [Alkalilimnicola sp. S0819]